MRTPGLSGPGSNGRDRVFYTPQIFNTGASQLDVLQCDNLDTQEVIY